MNWADEWLSVLFSDKKRLNLDGPDGWAYYWYDICKKPQTFFSRQQGRGSGMLKGVFSYNGTTNTVFLKGRQCSEDYQKMLKSQLLPFEKLLGEGGWGDEWIYQQDNCSIHMSNTIMQWFRQN